MKRSLWSTGIGPWLLLALLPCFACSDNEPAPGQWPISRAELTRGAAPADTAGSDPAELTYKRYCIGCHGSDGQGNGGTTGANLSAADGPLHTRSDAELIASVRDGKVGKVASMPAHAPILKPEQIAAVVSYVRRQFGQAIAPQ